jgi:hypothetical protein
VTPRNLFTKYDNQGVCETSLPVRHHSQAMEALNML